VSIGLIDSVSGFCIQLLLIVVITISGLATLDIAADSTSSSDSTSGVDWETLLTAFGLLAIAFLAALLVPRFRSMMTRFLHGLRERAADGRDALKVLRHPDKLLFLFGGNLIAQVMLAIILGLCLKAFGYSATLAELILVNTFVRRTHRDRHPRVGRRIDRAHGPADHLLHSTHVGGRSPCAGCARTDTCSPGSRVQGTRRLQAVARSSLLRVGSRST
jgi:hypothetical protein